MRILIVHPGLGAGGSEARALVLIEALAADHAVTLLTGTVPEWQRLNAAYDTAIDPGCLTLAVAPMPARLRTAHGGDALRGAFVDRAARRMAGAFELCIGTYNFTGFGRPAIQFVADFSFDDAVRRRFDGTSPGLRGALQAAGPARAAYLSLCRMVAGRPVAGHRPAGRRTAPRLGNGDRVVANSRWTAALLEARHGITSDVVYPPVHGPLFRPVERSGDFVMLGRIAPDKRVVEAIDLLSRVRRRGHGFALHIVGDVRDDAYGREVRRRALEAGDWVRLTGGLHGAAKFAFLNRHGFALHMRRREAFGIAVAEMVKMGLVPFVPGDSAPAEIVGDDRLTFEGADDAVERIDALLRRPQELAAIRAGLAGRGRAFSVEAFRNAALAIFEAELRQLGPICRQKAGQ
ncbi:MAG: hypothetical protein CMP81_00650 [Fulvimarina sp.]|nr:hypothetical protein [Fulvimarina sp.]